MRRKDAKRKKKQRTTKTTKLTKRGRQKSSPVTWASSPCGAIRTGKIPVSQMNSFLLFLVLLVSLEV